MMPIVFALLIATRAAPVPPATASPMNQPLNRRQMPWPYLPPDPDKPAPVMSKDGSTTDKPAKVALPVSENKPSPNDKSSKVIEFPKSEHKPSSPNDDSGKDEFPVSEYKPSPNDKTGRLLKDNTKDAFPVSAYKPPPNERVSTGKSPVNELKSSRNEKPTRNAFPVSEYKPAPNDKPGQGEFPVSEYKPSPIDESSNSLGRPSATTDA